MKNIFRPYIKFTTFLISVIIFIFLSGPISTIKLLSDKYRRQILSQFLKIMSTFALKFMGIKLQIQRQVTITHGPHLIVANHVSYLDILILASLYPSAFVTSLEIKKTPFLGFLTQVAGCLYVERRSRDNLYREVSEITNSLKLGINVVIFPEATSTRGENVLRFKSPLFQAAIDSSVPVLPITLNYKIDPFVRDNVFWYGDMTFLSHLWRFFQMDKTEVQVIQNPALSTEGVHCKNLALNSHHAVTIGFLPILDS